MVRTVVAGEGRDRLGVWDRHIHTTIYKTASQQGPTVQHRADARYLVITDNGKEPKKE